MEEEGIHSKNNKKFQLMREKLSQNKRIKKEKIQPKIKVTDGEEGDSKYIETPKISPLNRLKRLSISSENTSILTSEIPPTTSWKQTNSIPKKRKLESQSTKKTTITMNNNISNSTSSVKFNKKKKHISRWNFLIDIKDANQNKIGTENYNPKTLFIPSGEYSNLVKY